jgi:hypothetical protein
MPKEMLCGNYRYHEKIHAQRNVVWVILDIQKDTYMPNGILCVNRTRRTGDKYPIQSNVWRIINVTKNTHVKDTVSE